MHATNTYLYYVHTGNSFHYSFVGTWSFVAFCSKFMSLLASFFIITYITSQVDSVRIIA